jgi:hypothetical protein
VKLSCLDSGEFDQLREFPIDTARSEVVVNQLNNQALVHIYVAEAAQFE